jgi:hypothetical protein
MDAKFQSLMERMCRLGQLLNEADIETAIDNDDATKIAEIEMLLAEFNKTNAEMDAFLLEQRQERSVS